MRSIAVLGVLVVFGCGGKEECKGSPAGTYATTFQERSGDCGAIPEQIENYNGTPGAAPEGCTDSGGPVPDSCDVAMNRRCNATLANGVAVVITLEGIVRFNEAGTQGNGIIEANVTAANGDSCHSTYNLTRKKL
jgi:hypothetical protein